MTTGGVAIARSFLDRLEAAIAARDLASLKEFCTDNVALFGTARANFGLEETSDYLRLVTEQNTIRWFLDRWSVLHHDDGHLLVAAAGRVESNDGSETEDLAFRLSLWLMQQQGEWRMKHFHGSIPEPPG
jgi:ketosteroid isomerase-like protein